MHGPGLPPLTAALASKRFVSWEERFVSNDRGSRVVHLYLKDRHGSLTLAVVGTERSRRHMVYMVCDEFLPLCGLDKSATWRSRREVVDWLSSLVSKSASASPAGSDSQVSLSDAAGEDMDEDDIHKYSQDVLWVGPLWTCRKRLKHYNSFRRNGITISVKSFVYVMSEQKEHHIAYVQDMYEDKKSRKKLRVRWFHKTNELACKIPLPVPHPREVFFTQFQQVISVECVDGLATVLAPEHFEKCLSVFTSDTLELIHPCSRQFDAEGVKPFNICDVEGYWYQKALGALGVAVEGSDEDEDEDGGRGLPNTRYCRRKRHKGHSNSSTATTDTEGNGFSDVDLSKVSFEVGDKIELLCQDSALRGCWFTGTVISKVSRRVKVRYDDLQDEDGKENLEEWVSTARFAASDKLNIHAQRRLTARPCPPANTSPVACSFGCPVDVWWNDGWWEGVVISRCLGNEVRVYFPDEGDTASFKVSDLRPSRDWVNGQWRTLRANSDTVTALDFGVLCGSKPSLQSCRYARQVVDGGEQDEIEQQLLRIAEAAEVGSRMLEEDNADKKTGKELEAGCFDSCKYSKEANVEDCAGDMEIAAAVNWRSSNPSDSKKPRLNNSSSSSIHNPAGMVFSSSLPPLVLSSC